MPKLYGTNLITRCSIGQHAHCAWRLCKKVAQKENFSYQKKILQCRKTFSINDILFIIIQDSDSYYN